MNSLEKSHRLPVCTTNQQRPLSDEVNTEPRTWLSGDRKSKFRLFVFAGHVRLTTCDLLNSLEDNIQEKAIQTVAQGQKSENLLDFDMDEPAAMADTSISPAAFGSVPNGGGSAAVQQALAKNPLDELMDLFASNTMAAPTGPPSAPGQMSTASLFSSPAAAPAAKAAPVAPPKADAFSGLDDFGFGGTSNNSSQQTKPPAASQNDDLLGLF